VISVVYEIVFLIADIAAKKIEIFEIFS